MQSRLYIIAAPSGGGKTSLVRGLLAREPNICLSVSYTSRPPRPGEINGVHYHFVDKTQFEAMAARGEFLEHCVVHGDLKGTARSAVEPLLHSGRHVLLEIDYQGARKVRAQMSDCVSVFILPPSREELERRLRDRAQDSEAVIARRMANSREEIAHAKEFDHIVVNDVFADALEDLVAIVRGQPVPRPMQNSQLEQLLQQLLAKP
jgi:guanylate kinase